MCYRQLSPTNPETLWELHKGAFVLSLLNGSLCRRQGDGGGGVREGRREEERDRHSITALLTVPTPSSSPILMDLRLQSLPADARTGSSEPCGVLFGEL